MHTTHSDTRASARLNSVQDLLGELGNMKSEGLGARERIDIIRRQGSALLDGDFELEDAFDVEARVRTEHHDKLRSLGHAIDSLAALWAQGPFSEEVKEAGGKLFGHVEGFVRDARVREEASETEMLSLLWDWAPDIRWLYPWLTSWTGPIKAPNRDAVRRHGVPSADYDEIEVEEEVPEPVTATPPENAQAQKEERELERRFLAHALDELEKKREGPDLDSSEKAEEDVEAPKEDIPEPAKVEEPEAPKPGEATRGFPVERNEEPVSVVERDHRVVAKVHEDPAAVEYAADADKLHEQTWTRALRDVTLEDWNLRTRGYGHIGGLGMGTALIWQHGTSEKHEVRLDLIELGASVLTARLEPGTLGDVQVRMVIDSPKHGRRTAEKRMTREQLLELHLDPAPFIEKALADE